MALDSKTAELAAKAKLDEKAVEWLIRNDILTCEDVAFLAAKEDQVETSLLKVLDLEFEGALRKEVDRLGVDNVHHL